jgi:hypothetical protein
LWSYVVLLCDLASQPGHTLMLQLHCQALLQPQHPTQQVTAVLQLLLPGPRTWQGQRLEPLLLQTLSAA